MSCTLAIEIELIWSWFLVKYLERIEGAVVENLFSIGRWKIFEVAFVSTN